MTSENPLLTSKSEILRARAQALAKEDADPLEGSAFLEVVEFSLAVERYAMETTHVREVQPLRQLTRLPGTPAFVAGIVNVRGHILPVLDIRKFFGLPDRGITDAHQVLLVRHEDTEVGILADLVIGLRSVRRDSLETSLPMLSGIRGEYLRGVTPDRVAILDAARILSDRRILVHEEPES